MTDPHLPFLRAICAHPADDVPRLVYADYLDECGEPERAEFIRLQCDLAKLGLPDGPCLPGCSCGGLGARARKLIGRCGDLWNPLLRGETPGAIGYVWNRGFVSKVTCAFADWFAHAAAIRERHPVERVSLTTWPDVRTEEFDDLPNDCRVRRLSLRIGEKEWRQDFAESRYALSHVASEGAVRAMRRDQLEKFVCSGLQMLTPGVAFDLPPADPVAQWVGEHAEQWRQQVAARDLADAMEGGTLAADVEWSPESVALARRVADWRRRAGV